jgi:pilus assembly protein CpaD
MALALALTMTACTLAESGVEPAASRPYQEPPQPHARIVAVPASLGVALPDRTGAFVGSERDRLGAFLDAYRDGGRGPLKATIVAPTREAAGRAEAALRALARRRGVVDDALVVTAGAGSRPGLTLGYTDFVAVPPSCQPEVALSRNPDAEVSPNLGCALERDVAAMLAHPADSLAPAAEAPAEAARMARVLDLYRQGKATEADVNRNDTLNATAPSVSK